MRIRRLEISNFRGIKQLSWYPVPGVSCLLGPGNSCKTTVLDAITLLFSPRRTVTVHDADFWNCDVSAGIRISAVVTGLPAELLDFERFGDLLCGWSEDGTLHPDPDDEVEVAMQVVFRADDSLEPIWEVVKPGEDGSERPFRASDRDRAAVFRVEERPDFHLRWARGSALAALTSDPATVLSTLTEAHRSARKAVFSTQMPPLQDTADEVKVEASNVGAASFGDLRPGLDPSAISSLGALVLHDGEVPVAAEGLGVRRLTSLAIQRLRHAGPAVLLIDEVEHGLEPHRLLRVLRLIQEEADEGTQVILTTHSPIVVEALTATQLVVVRSDEGTTVAHPVPAALDGMKLDQVPGTVRSGPSAMLARRVLVVEGDTEEGFLRRCTRRWDDSAPNLAVLGVAVRNGGNDQQALERAGCLAALGYEAGAMLDHDKPLKDEAASAAAQGAVVLRTVEGTSFEQHLFRDLPIELVPELLTLAISLRPEGPASDVAKQAVHDGLVAKLPPGVDADGENPVDWLGERLSETDLRKSLGDASGSGKWFKSQSKGEALASFVLEHVDAFPSGEGSFIGHIGKVRQFLYEGNSGAASAS